MLSGINLGPNLGNAMWHSGTLAAAKQAALLGLRGIAFSTPTGGSEPDFARLRPWVRRVLQLLFPETSLCLVNVNLPPEPAGAVLDAAVGAALRRPGGAGPGPDGPGALLVHRGAGGGGGGRNGPLGGGAGLVSITPLRLDLTDVEALERVKEERPV